MSARFAFPVRRIQLHYPHTATNFPPKSSVNLCLSAQHVGESAPYIHPAGQPFTIKLHSTKFPMKTLQRLNMTRASSLTGAGPLQPPTPRLTNGTPAKQVYTGLAANLR